MKKKENFAHELNNYSFSNEISGFKEMYSRIGHILTNSFSVRVRVWSEPSSVDFLWTNFSNLLTSLFPAIWNRIHNLNQVKHHVIWIRKHQKPKHIRRIPPLDSYHWLYLIAGTLLLWQLWTYLMMAWTPASQARAQDFAAESPLRWTVPDVRKRL